MKPRPIKLITAEILIVAAGVLFLTLPPPMLKAASPGQEQIEKSIRDAYVGKTLRLRNFYIGTKLEFDFKGSVLGAQDVGPWTLYCRILVDSIKLQSRVLDIHAHRLFLHYLNQEKKFEELHDGEVEIQIALDHEPFSTQELQPLLDKIFVKPKEDFSALVPPYWKEFCSHTNDPDWNQKELDRFVAEGKARTKADTPPVPIFKPEPFMTTEERQAKINGSMALFAVIDEYGHVSDIMLVTPLGMGVDEKAVETLRTWKFKPAQLNGHAIPKNVVVQFTFRTF